MRLSGRALALIALVLAVCVAPAGYSRAELSARTGGDQFTPVIQSVPSPPRWFKGDDGRFHLEYELVLTNASPVPVTARSLEVRGQRGRVIETLSGDDLEAAMSLLGTPGQPTTELGPSTVGVAWVDLEFARRGAIPERLTHRLTVDVAPGLPVHPTITDTGGSAVVASRPAVLVGAPLRGPRWTAIVGAHRRALQPVNGGLHSGQRFATDWNLLDAENRLVFGDPAELTSYPSYGQPVLAVDDARVVEAVDGIPNQDPSNFVPVGAAEADGNFVVLRLGPRTFAGYAHLVPGSVRVERGERVKEGQVLGRLGNSGNSDGPHLHFQLMNRRSLLVADGLPVTFKRFELAGRVTSLEALVEANETQAPVPIDRTETGPRRRVGLTGLELLTFPGR